MSLNLRWRDRGLVVQLGGLEPPTSGSTIRRSNQLSYNCTSQKEGRKLWPAPRKSKACGAIGVRELATSLDSAAP